MNILLPERLKQAGEMRLGVCGGRYNEDAQEELSDTLDHALQHCDRHRPRLELVIIQGACRTGTDRCARLWCWHNHVRFISVHAEWKKYGHAAGPRRNQLMVDRYNLDGCIACRGGNGTADMCRRCRAANIPVFEIELLGGGNSGPCK